MSDYLDETDALIVRAAEQILKRAARNWPARVSEASAGTAEIMNIAAMQAKMDAAAEAISTALIAVTVHAEHYPASAPEPQSLRA